jgi:hypothetical protein
MKRTAETILIHGRSAEAEANCMDVHDLLALAEEGNE